MTALAALLIFALCGVLPIVGHVLATRRIAMRNDRRRGIDSQIHRLGLPDVRTAGDLLAFLAIWPCIDVIGWIVFDPYGFRDAVLRVVGL